MSNSILCPICKIPLNRIVYKRLEIDVCFQCKGVWFDKDEIWSFLWQYGDKESGISEKFYQDEAQDINKVKNCPRCDIPMGARSWEYLDRIAILDLCPKCKGVWADRGEVFQLASRREGYRPSVHMTELGRSILQTLHERRRYGKMGILGRILSKYVFRPLPWRLRRERKKRSD